MKEQAQTVSSCVGRVSGNKVELYCLSWFLWMLPIFTVRHQDTLDLLGTHGRSVTPSLGQSVWDENLVSYSNTKQGYSPLSKSSMNTAANRNSAHVSAWHPQSPP